MRAGLGGRGSKFRSAAQSLGEGKKNRENRFPGARSRGPLRPGSWTKRGRDTPRVEPGAPTLTPQARGTDAWREEVLWTRIS